jgi:hypothetical protein
MPGFGCLLTLDQKLAASRPYENLSQRHYRKRVFASSNTFPPTQRGSSQNLAIETTRCAAGGFRGGERVAVFADRQRSGISG